MMKKSLKIILALAAALLVIFLLVLILAKKKVIFLNEWFVNEKNSTIGVDISAYQADVDMEKLKEQNVAFVYMKATEGSTHRDERFAENWENAEKAGLPSGAYHFFSYDSPGSDQAENFISTVGRNLAGRLLPVVDVEYYGDKEENPPAKEDVVRELTAFLAALEEQYGIRPMIYTRPDIYKKYLDGFAADYKFWISSLYTPLRWNYKGDWYLWQYLNRGKLEGYSGGEQYIDLNVLNKKKDLSELLIPASPGEPVGYSPEAEKAIGDFVRMYGSGAEGYDGSAYVVSDFDNTTAVFDITYQCSVYQLETMSFAMDPDELEAALGAGLDLTADDNALWIEDIVRAYRQLFESYGPFTAAGLEESALETLHADPWWVEFATKMRAFFLHVEDMTPEEVNYVWILFWYSGMSRGEVYDLFYRSCSAYEKRPSESVTWTSPEEIESRLGVVSCEFTSGVSVPEDVKRMMRTVFEGGIDVWICSASHLDGVRAAVDAFGLGEFVTGVIGMTQKEEDGVYAPAYDYETGYAWKNLGGGKWERTDYAIFAMPGLEGKVTAVENALVPQYGAGPLAGFMDSSGDFNFCTEFDSLRMVICYNRANRKITEGGGLVGVAAVYQREALGYDLATANAAGDTLYLLQGRDENGARTLRPAEETIRLGQTEPRLFANEDNEALLNYAKESGLSTEDFFNTFAIATEADDPANPIGLDFGHLKEYRGYHSVPDPGEAEEEAA